MILSKVILKRSIKFIWKMRNSRIELEEERRLKDLLFEQGKPLENAVIKALKIIGYKAENYDDGVLEMDQIIISPEKIGILAKMKAKIIKT